MRPYRPGDEDAFNLRADFAEERAATAWDWSRGAPGPTWTIYRWSGEIVGIGGAVDQGDGLWQAWAQLADAPRRDWPQLLWLASRVLGYVETHHGAAAIEAMARTSNPAAISCLQRLGFRAPDAHPAAAAYVHLYRGC